MSVRLGGSNQFISDLHFIFARKSRTAEKYSSAEFCIDSVPETPKQINLKQMV
jgi:hypothetical protein